MLARNKNLSRTVNELTGNCGTVEVYAGQSTALTVAPRAVAIIIVEPTTDDVSLVLKVGEGAGAHLLVSSLPVVSKFTIEVAAQARCTFTVLAAPTAPSTFLSEVSLIGDGAHLYQQVIVLGSGTSEVALDTKVKHQARNTVGRLVVRRVQWGASSSVLHGLLRVEEGAHGTDTYLSDKALLLGEKARAVAVPGLEILADDVKASHGATVGQLAADELFYLRSRGLPKRLAQQLLVRAFLAPALVGVPPDVVARLERNLTAYVPTHAP